MQAAVATPGRTLVVVLEPGDEVLGSLAEACRRHGIDQAVITTFSGAFRSGRIIAADHAPADPELPMPDATTISYCEGVGSGTVTRADDGTHVVHVHVAFGAKDRAGASMAGHLLEAETHYVVEVALTEILDPPLGRIVHAGSSGIPILHLGEAAPSGAA